MLYNKTNSVPYTLLVFIILYFNQLFTVLNRKRSKYNCSLYKHMESVWRKTLDIPEPEFSLFAHQQFDETVKSYRHSVISTIESYIKVSEKNIAFLDTAYAELDFVFKNKSLRNMIYKEIHKPLFEHKNLIDEKSYHFRTYLQANHGNTPVMLDYIDELQKTLFTVKKSSHDQFDFFIIYYTFLDNMDDKLEELRCEINKEEYIPINHHAFLQHSIRVE